MYCVSDLRLVNGDDGSGELQFLNATEWVPVCYTSQLDEITADIACHQLGYPFAVEFHHHLAVGLG